MKIHNAALHETEIQIIALEKNKFWARLLINHFRGHILLTPSGIIQAFP